MKLQLPDEYVDSILQALTEKPWKDVNPIIQTILAQANNKEFQNADANGALGHPSPPAESGPGGPGSDRTVAGSGDDAPAASTPATAPGSDDPAAVRGPEAGAS
jgi:hypothetical protein